MHDLKLFVENEKYVRENLGKRNYDLKVVDQVLVLNDKRKSLIQFVENHRADLKKISQEVGMKKKAGEDATELVNRVATIKDLMAQSETDLDQTQKDLNYLLATIPNLIADDVPVGKDESFNKEVKKWGTPRSFNFKVKDHVELGEALGLLDFERGVKLTGSRFVVYKGAMAKMERALINFMLDIHEAKGYTEILPPFMVNADCMFGTGQLPKFAEDAFKIEGRDWYLIPPAEVPVTNLKRDELFSKDELPIKYAAYTPCFRSEAGSYGKDTKGLIRLHQFNKVEMVNITSPEESPKAHQAMIEQACSILEALNLPYRAVLLCSGDMGFGAQKCIDLEVWLPGQDKFREISSISNCGEFQARRANIRFRGDDKKPVYAHTLNGSGLAVGRTLVAIMENYQNEDGSITIPEVLRPYMGGLAKIG